jgi:hypothetical protein
MSWALREHMREGFLEEVTLIHWDSLLEMLDLPTEWMDVFS